jgi:hypothetical protein
MLPNDALGHAPPIPELDDPDVSAGVRRHENIGEFRSAVLSAVMAGLDPAIQ